jgi:hypothetical protein
MFSVLTKILNRFKLSTNKEIIMNVILTDKKVTAYYDHQTVTGTVIESFMTLTIESDPVMLHRVKFDNPLKVSWSDKLKETLLVDNNFILSVH